MCVCLYSALKSHSLTGSVACAQKDALQQYIKKARQVPTKEKKEYPLCARVCVCVFPPSLATSCITSRVLHCALVLFFLSFNNTGSSSRLLLLLLCAVGYQTAATVFGFVNIWIVVVVVVVVVID